MSDYYEFKVSNLSEALKCCEGFRSFGSRLVFRGQSNAEWDLKSGLFRGQQGKEERDNLLNKTIAFIQWCREQNRLPSFSDDQFLQIAQHYGMPTDLLDFSTSLEVAAFFAIGAPRHGLPSADTDRRAAIFILNPLDLAEIPKLATLPPTLKKVAQKYVGAVQECSVPGLSRLVAQDGLFVRDVGGTLENLTDPYFSYLPVVMECEIGHPLFLKKVSFIPNESDIQLLASHGCTYDRLFPPPNDLEREIVRFIDRYAAWEWEQRREKDAVVLNLGGRAFTHPTTIETWNTEHWQNWTKLNLATDRFVRPRSSELTDWEIPQAEISSGCPSPSISAYIRQAFADGADFKSRFKLKLTSMNERGELPARFDTILETLLAFPYSEAQLELALRMTIRLFLEASPFGAADPLMHTTQGQAALARVFGEHTQWFSLDIVCYGDRYSRQIMIPVEPFAELDSVKNAVEQFEGTDIGKEYGKSDSLEKGVFHIFFHRPQFRSLLRPEDAIRLWAQYVIPWQACFGNWSAAILNPFSVEYIGHS